ncbi:MAG TPA: prolyl oligopeptidase family serine peptidase [Pirellulales bacterium]|jgi:acetyl esterase/lipase|nr:prolyl oligopeptidase family serine peptidase [Pirellulales bacterium]
MASIVVPHGRFCRVICAKQYLLNQSNYITILCWPVPIHTPNIPFPPPTLITTADRDDRVVPGHSFKFAAALQAAQAGPAPILIRIKTQAGHGAGKPTTKIIEETADEFAFLVDILKMDLQPKP